jgi:hypothetical protein
MIDFQGCNRPIAMAHFYKTGERENAFVAAEVQLPFFVTGFFDVDHGIANVDYGDAPLGYWPEKINKFRSHSSLAIGQIGGWWRHFQAIFKDDAPDSNRFKYMLIT